MFDLPQQLAVRQWGELDSQVRVVIVHPNFFKQHVLLQEILGQDGIVYVRFDGVDLTEEQLNEQLEQALAVQVGGTALKNVKCLVLDECDRARKDASDAFLPAVFGRLAGGRLVVVSRVMPPSILGDPILRDCTRFVPTDDDLMYCDYCQRDESTALLEVRALGSGRVFLNGRRVENWDGILPRALFFYLVDRGMTTRSEIFETFWPNLSTREATNVFHVTKRKISEVLGVDLTAYWSGFYHIAAHIELVYDAALFSTMLQNSAVAPLEEATEFLARAVLLYRGDFLTTLEMKWVKKRRQELLQSYGEALVGLAKAMEDVGKDDHALGLYLRAVVTNPQREDLVRNIMRLYYNLGMREDALATFQRLEEELDRSLGVAPAPQVQELAATIQAGEARAI